MIDTMVLTNEDLQALTVKPERVKLVWEQFPKLKEEFPNFATFEAYVRALQRDQVSVCTVAGVTSMAEPSTVKGRL